MTLPPLKMLLASKVVNNNSKSNFIRRDTIFSKYCRTQILEKKSVSKFLKLNENRWPQWKPLFPRPETSNRKRKEKQGKKKLLIAPHIVSDSRGYQSFKLAKSRRNVKMEKYQKRKNNVASSAYKKSKANLRLSSHKHHFCINKLTVF